MAKKTQVAAPESGNSEQDEATLLRQQLDEMRGRLSSTESALSDERSHRQRAELAQMSEAEQRIVAQQDACESTLSALDGQATSIEAQIANLSDEPGHGAEVSKLTREIARIEAKILQEGQRKDWLASQREQAKQQRATPQPSAADRKLANGVSTGGFSPTTRSWLDRHPKAFEDAAYAKRIIAHAINAVDVEGLQVDTPEYFASIEEKIGERQAPRQAADVDDGDDIMPTAESPYSRPTQTDDGGEIDYTPRQPQPRAAGPGSTAAAAPPSRSIPNQRTPSGPKRVPALTPDEREVANELFASDPSCKTEADRLRLYAERKAFMDAYRPSHFGAN